MSIGRPDCEEQLLLPTDWRLVLFMQTKLTCIWFGVTNATNIDTQQSTRLEP